MEAEMEQKNVGRFWMRLTALVSVSFALGFLAYWYYLDSRMISTDNAYVESEIVSVNSRMMGYVREVFVEENQLVKKGERLLKLDDSDTKIELMYKESKFKKAEADFKRAQGMWHHHGISDSDFELAQATKTGHQADLEGSRLKLSFTEVVSPVEGIIAKRSAQPGQFVQPGQSLFVVVPNERIWIRANYKETKVQYLKIGQPVEIRVDAYPGKLWLGKLVSIYPSTVASLSLLPPENTTGNFTKVVQRFPVKISVEQGDARLLRPGMSVVTKVIVD